jgi:hypothetical protein
LSLLFPILAFNFKRLLFISKGYHTNVRVMNVQHYLLLLFDDLYMWDTCEIHVRPLSLFPPQMVITPVSIVHHIMYYLLCSFSLQPRAHDTLT